MRSRLLGIFALMAVVVASCGGAAPQASGPSEGIQVHGDWTIDIVNADGSLDRTVEFSNALTSSGEGQLSGFLAGTSTPGGWFIALNGSSSNGPCSTASPSSGTCDLDATATVGGSTGASRGQLFLTGEVTAENDGEIADVGTYAAFCSPSVAPADCTDTTSLGAPFTQKTLTAAETVSAGQSIQVEVVISFTSG